MSYDPEPLSKTAKYKKITKPLLERKRRARINRCLDELKDLMVGALEIDDDNLSKLEKADILELTVNHLTKLHSPKDPVLEAKKFQAGFGQCAAEACRFIMSIPDLDRRVSQNLVSHLSRLISTQPLTVQVPERPYYSPPHSPSSTVSDRHHYYSDPDRSSSDPEDGPFSGESAFRQYPRAENQMPYQPLLTTAPRHQQRMNDLVENLPRRTSYSNKVQAEEKEAILKKIRQHIMDKRVNEDNEYGKQLPETQNETKSYVREDVPTNGLLFPYSVLNIPETIETLDLRKVRSNNQSEQTVESKKEQVLMEQKLPQEYNNLPPKKKRKLIEYQEQMRKEEASKKAYLQEQREIENQTDCEEALKWRPW